MRENQTRKLAACGLMAAMIFVITWAVKLPVPFTSAGAYVNLGDSVIYLTAYLLGGWMGVLASGIGSMLADILAGAGVYILPTLIIKSLMGLVCWLLMRRSEKFGPFLLGSIVGGLIMVVGYGAFEWAFFGAAYAITSLPFNLIQLGGGVIIAIPLFFAGKKLKLHLLGPEKKN